MHAPAPVIGQWYRGFTGELFEVVAIDNDDDTIEIQYFDATLEELDSETWAAQGVVEADPPEDWTGSVDVEPEDYELEPQATTADGSVGALEFLDRNEASGYSEVSMGVRGSSGR
ncbi:MAG: hypothetical protein H7Y02_12415 [Candidatus Obscuribacterales bacterium]|nr:hypothetical protein [Steroidobacteraceae bacterium]